MQPLVPSQSETQPRVILFTIALNGYSTVYAECIASHQAYAKRCGYTYVSIDRPRRLVAPDVSSWVKIPLMLQALKSGYDWVFFVDADCEIKLSAPRVESIEVPDKSLYMAMGYSNRLNAGVFILKNTPAVRRFLETLLEKSADTIPPEDQALYENGHVIHFSKGQPYLQVLDRKWNNNSEPGLNDYIRHYSAGGPMRKLYRKSFTGFAMHVANRVQTKLWRKLRPGGTVASQLRSQVDALAAKCRTVSPLFDEKIQSSQFSS